MLSVGSNIQPHTCVLPVAKESSTDNKSLLIQRKDAYHIESVKYIVMWILNLTVAQ